jgi:hypothetical protein
MPLAAPVITQTLSLTCMFSLISFGAGAGQQNDTAAGTRSMFVCDQLLRNMTLVAGLVFAAVR